MKPKTIKQLMTEAGVKWIPVEGELPPRVYTPFREVKNQFKEMVYHEGGMSTLSR